MTLILIGKIASLLLLVGLGFGLGRRRFLASEAITTLARLLIDVTLPALILVGMLKGGRSFFSAGWWIPFLGGAAVSLLGFLVARLIAPLAVPERPRRGTFYFLSAIGNSSFLPVPLCHALWGTRGVLLCLLYVVGNNLVLFTLGVWVLRASAAPGRTAFSLGELGPALRTPQILAFALGALGLVLGVGLPGWLLEPLELLGNATIPLSMLTVGAILSEIRLERDLDLGLQLGALVIKLVLVPALVLGGLKLGLRGAEAAPILLLQAAMPSFASASVFARRYGGDPYQAAAGTLLTTVLAPLTLPFWMSLW